MPDVTIMIKGRVSDEVNLEDVATEAKLWIDSNPNEIFVGNSEYKVEIRPVSFKDEFYMKKEEEE